MPAAQDSPSSQSRPRVKIDRGAANVRVTLSLPSGTGRPNRKKVLDRARRMLAAALEEEQRGADKAEEASTGKAEAASPAPGNGAWWLF